MRFPDDSPDAVLSTLDRMRSDSAHTYTWQLSHDDQGDGREARPGRTGRVSGRSTSVLRGEEESYLKGWMMHPTEATVERGRPLRVRTEGPGPRSGSS